MQPKRKQADTPRIQKGKAAKGKEREGLRRLGGTGESDLEGKVGSKINSAPHNKNKHSLVPPAENVLGGLAIGGRERNCGSWDRCQGSARHATIDWTIWISVSKPADQKKRAVVGQCPLNPQMDPSPDENAV